MKPFNKTNRFSKRDSGRSGGRGSDFELTEVICDKCGRKCDVPFKPTGGKPIYCRTCFRENSLSESKDSSKSFSKKRFDDNFESKTSNRFESRGQSSPDAEELQKINRKLDKIMKALKIEY